VKVVIVLNVESAVIGTLLVIQAHGLGSVITRIGQILIRIGGATTTFSNNSRFVMVKHVFLNMVLVFRVFLLVLILILKFLVLTFVCVRITLRVTSNISVTLKS
jgi:hypothetical protein